jgi:D-3-phosphoglycerate dehydrogenase
MPEASITSNSVVGSRRPVVLCSLAMDPAGAALLAPFADIVTAPDPGAETLYSMIGDADFLLVRSSLPDDLFDRPNRLRGVIRNGTGIDLIPVASATAHGIPVANVPGVNARAVAEYCLTNFLLLARRVGEMNITLRTQGWIAARALATNAIEATNKTVGIIGLGAVGSALARICHDGFGMKVLGVHPNPERMPDFVQSVDIDTLFSSSDFISLNCPLTPATRHLANADRLGRMKPDAILVNAARGPVVDEVALVNILCARRIGGAALDVFDSQPLAADHPFLTLQNVILTPHAAALTRETSDKVSIIAANQILELLRGERPQHLVNPEVWEQRTQLIIEQSGFREETT